MSGVRWLEKHQRQLIVNFNKIEMTKSVVWAPIVSQSVDGGFFSQEPYFSLERFAGQLDAYTA